MRRADENDEKEDEKSPRPDAQSSEIAKALYKSRTVLIFGEVDMKMAERVTAQLLAYAESEGDIRVIVNSPGGHVESGDTIHDMIRFVGNRVKVIGTGWVASAGAHIFLGAKKENRFCLPFTRFLLHQPLGGVRGQASDITIEAGRNPQDARPPDQGNLGRDRTALREGRGRHRAQFLDGRRRRGQIRSRRQGHQQRQRDLDPWPRHLGGAVRRSIRSMSAAFATAMATGRATSPGLISKLDYVAALGVDAIWLSPIHPSPNRDWGYDVSDYETVHPDYGTLADFQTLLDAAHARGLKVILDEVLAHTSDEHAWFAASRDGDESKRDWYVWADPKDDGTVPNNWLSVFGGPAWSYQPARRQYYHHKFLRQQPKLNWMTPAGARSGARGAGSVVEARRGRISPGRRQCVSARPATARQSGDPGVSPRAGGMVGRRQHAAAHSRLQPGRKSGCSGCGAAAGGGLR